MVIFRNYHSFGQRFPTGHADANLIVVALLTGFTRAAGRTIFGNIQNTGTGSITLTMDSSTDNAVADTWGAVTFRVDASDKTSLVIPAGGNADFTVEWAAQFGADLYLRFVSAPASGAISEGMLALAYTGLKLEFLQRTGILF